MTCIIKSRNQKSTILNCRTSMLQLMVVCGNELINLLRVQTLRKIDQWTWLHSIDKKALSLPSQFCLIFPHLGISAIRAYACWI